MTSNTESNPSRRHTPPTRLLAFLLLALITYGATAETVHSHGGLLLARHIVSAEMPAASDTGEADSSSQQARTLNECVICQLHQHLSNTLLSALPWTTPPPAQFTPTRAISISYLSPTCAPRRGRAPPPASLS
ncbi:MAG TPA: DUF2946 family protein [Pyrinomonadaceae bacterium]